MVKLKSKLTPSVQNRNRSSSSAPKKIDLSPRFSHSLTLTYVPHFLRSIFLSLQTEQNLKIKQKEKRNNVTEKHTSNQDSFPYSSSSHSLAFSSTLLPLFHYLTPFLCFPFLRTRTNGHNGHLDRSR